MEPRREDGTKRYRIVFILIWAVQMAAAFYFCTQKQGFHEDEYYTYYSTARTNGFYLNDGEWMDRDVYRNEFVVLPKERFRYGLVRLVQSWDVHPPVYYWVFHTVESLTPNVFSKWTGLAINLVLHGVNIVLVALLSYRLAGRNRGTALFTVLFWGFGTAVMSGVVFIRMYELLTTFVLACAILHVHALERKEAELPVFRCLLPMAALTYLGFLTHYYYFIFLFYLGAAFCVCLLIRDRHIRNGIRYGAAQGSAFVLAWLTYPACLGQMFRGQRGAQASANFFDLSNTVERIRFFYDLMNRYAFGHLFPAVLFAAAALAAVIFWRDRRFVKMPMQYWMLLSAAVGYFLTVSKTALLLGDTSNRYQLPIYGIAAALASAAVGTLWRAFAGGRADLERYGKYAAAAVLAVCLAAVLTGYSRDGMIFLYPEDKEQTDYAVRRAKEDTPSVYLYQPGEEWCIWDVANELFAYPEIYFASAGGSGAVDDGRIRDAGSLVAYIAKGADRQEQIGRLLDSAPKLTDYRLVFEEKYCDVYYFD